MNEEQILYRLKTFKEDYTDAGTSDAEVLDYAINVIELMQRLETGQAKKHASNKVIMYNREYLESHLEQEYDILKGARDMVVNLKVLDELKEEFKDE